MSDLQPYRPPQVEFVETYQDVAVRRLSDWAQSASAAHSIAGTLVQTSFCPDSFRNKPGEATAAILAGLEVGLQPMAALRSFDVIQGQAAPRAITLRAIVQSHGHEMILEESTATRCRMRGRRRGASEWQSVTWTLDRAKALNLTSKANWRQQPQAMLVARATGELARLIAADAILGLGYTAEEVADGGPVEAVAATETVDPTPTGTRRMSRATARPAPEELVADEGQSAPVESESPLEPDAPTPDRIDPKGAQMKAMQAAFRDANITERDDRLRFASETIGREIGSASDLTRDEASAVIDELKALVAGTADEGDTWAGEEE